MFSSYHAVQFTKQKYVVGEKKAITFKGTGFNAHWHIEVTSKIMKQCQPANYSLSSSHQFPEQNQISDTHTMG